MIKQKQLRWSVCVCHVRVRSVFLLTGLHMSLHYYDLCWSTDIIHPVQISLQVAMILTSVFSAQPQKRFLRRVKPT